MTVKNFILSAVMACGATCTSLADQLDTALFPGLDRYSEQDIRRHGLAHLYPGRVLFQSPELQMNSLRSHAARVEDLPRDIKYIRVYRLDEALKVIEAQIQHPALILDFRYLKSTDTGAPLALTLGRPESVTALQTIGKIPNAAMQSLAIDADHSGPVRDKPIIVLCNHETAGPFEAILDNLQSAGAAIVVGEPSLGRTGFYTKAGAMAWQIEGELRPSTALSLVGTGLQPRIPVECTAEENYISYHLYEAGTALKSLLQQPDEDKQSEEDSNPTDRVLQRGIDIVAALQILH